MLRSYELCGNAHVIKILENISTAPSRHYRHPQHRHMTALGKPAHCLGILKILGVILGGPKVPQGLW